MVPEFEPQGDAVKGENVRAKVLKRQASQSDDICTLYSIFTKDRELFDKGQEHISNLYLKMCLGRFRKPLRFK